MVFPLRSWSGGLTLEEGKAQNSLSRTVLREEECGNRVRKEQGDCLSATVWDKTQFRENKFNLLPCKIDLDSEKQKYRR